jgi:hypothetical protein
VKQEALLLLSNHFCNYKHQTRFINEVIGSGAEEWIISSSKAFKSPRDFMTFVGVDWHQWHPAVMI